jgi:hypothetical protein
MTTRAPVFLLALAMILAPSAGADGFSWRQDLLGTPAALQSAGRSMVIGPQTRHVNVVRNEVIRFDVGGKAFAWSFDGPLQVTSVDLQRVAPPGVLGHKVMAYISPDPLRDTHW